MRSFAAMAASLRLVGSGNPPLHRFRVGLEFGLSGHRDLDGMIAQHAALARALAAELGPAAETGSEFVQFSPQAQLAEVRAMMMANAQRAMQGA